MEKAKLFPLLIFQLTRLYNEEGEGVQRDFPRSIFERETYKISSDHCEVEIFSYLNRTIQREFSETSVNMANGEIGVIITNLFNGYIHVNLIPTTDMLL